MPDTTLTSAELDDNAVAKAMEAFVSNVRGQDPEWTDEYDEEITLVSPDGDGFALEYPIRDAIKAYLSLARAGLEAGKAEESMRERAAELADSEAALRKENGVAAEAGDTRWGLDTEAASLAQYHKSVTASLLAGAIRALPLTGGDKP